ncbi:tryptophan--tRNA ligase [Caminibacter mediatlanticus TB-2]|uniref:Tryptophan--tRNA ligase n=1 Tax=Caminibacter mediatlanticus TB-2 TaxID=391592 RepID=A0ABX5V615_9BACT|nr:tryptophan--tRNA ligase [Caminibacter mediatlanticus]QCT93691.1 tryptophan--tRNA ligase [Caminibacter mediatlanticus TB-2]
MRVVSGMRPTGKLHLGHYIGVIKNWKNLQDNYQCMFFVADWHALSTKYDEGLNLKELSIELIKEWIACGIDPQKATLFIQSAIKEHAELYLIFNMITPISWLERNPTYKDAMNQPEYKKKNNAGFLTYPVLQTADIVIYDADLVPIGEDQKPHLELAREIVRHFHYIYKMEIFKEPKEILTEVARLPGLDGRKMSKSYNNAIYLDETSDEIWQKVRMAKTDPARIKKTDPGHPEVCIVFDYHKAFSSEEEVKEIEEACKNGTIGCVECKKRCAKNIEKIIAPIRDKKASLQNDEILDIIKEGNKKAKSLAEKKMKEVNKVIF